MESSISQSKKQFMERIDSKLEQIDTLLFHHEKLKPKLRETTNPCPIDQTIEPELIEKTSQCLPVTTLDEKNFRTILEDKVFTPYYEEKLDIAYKNY